MSCIPLLLKCTVRVHCLFCIIYCIPLQLATCTCICSAYMTLCCLVHRVLEAELLRETQYDEEKAVCRALILHLQKILVAGSGGVGAGPDSGPLPSLSPPSASNVETVSPSTRPLSSERNGEWMSCLSV